MNLLSTAKIYKNSYGLSVMPVILSYKLDKNGEYETKIIGGKEVRKVDKKPAISTWRELQNKLPTDSELETGFSNPSVNAIGLITGKISGVTVLDWDETDSPYKSPVMVKTITGGYHSYYAYAEGVRNTVKVGGKTLDVRGDGGFVVIPPSAFDGLSYEWLINGDPKELLRNLPCFPNLETDHTENYTTGTDVPPFDIADALGAKEGTRNDTLHRVSCSLLSRNYDLISAKLVIVSINQTFIPPLDDTEVDAIFNSAKEFILKEKTLNNETMCNVPWPSPIAEEAFIGLAGDFVKTVGPQTEADSSALLFNFLCAFGSVIGPKPHIKIGAIYHPMRLFCVLVGKTAKGRKGDSWGYPKKIFSEIDLLWSYRISSGLVSGEGLIWNVRDAVTKSEPIQKGKRGPIEGYQDVISDEGVKDKRLFVMETEFASVLKVSARKDNTLSAIIRDAWDTGNLCTLSKNFPARATGAHITIMGHITREELRKLLNETETFNGFGNRFLWVCVSRSSYLAFGGYIPDIEIKRLTLKIKDAVNFSSTVDEIQWSEEAKPLWKSIYPELSEGKPGMLGAMTSRAESYVTRVAGIYALLDKSKFIQPAHLLAALAVWDYAENSAKYIFQTKALDSLTTRVLSALKGNPNGMTKTEIHRALNNNSDKEIINAALTTLKELGLARMDSNNGIERWFAVERQLNS
ncbi:MAG: bifunctional DNA primase/polymerase [Patescibacteria group bacterium]